MRVGDAQQIVADARLDAGESRLGQRPVPLERAHVLPAIVRDDEARRARLTGLEAGIDGDEASARPQRVGGELTQPARFAIVAVEYAPGA